MRSIKTCASEVVYLEIYDVVFCKQDSQVAGNGHVALQTAAAAAVVRSPHVVIRGGLPAR